MPYYVCDLACNKLHCVTPKKSWCLQCCKKSRTTCLGLNTLQYDNVMCRKRYLAHFLTVDHPILLSFNLIQSNHIFQWAIQTPTHLSIFFVPLFIILMSPKTEVLCCKISKPLLYHLVEPQISLLLLLVTKLQLCGSRKYPYPTMEESSLRTPRLPRIFHFFQKNGNLLAPHPLWIVYFFGKKMFKNSKHKYSMLGSATFYCQSNASIKNVLNKAVRVIWKILI